jgi:hypothetical protein
MGTYLVMDIFRKVPVSLIHLNWKNHIEYHVKNIQWQGLEVNWFNNQYGQQGGNRLFLDKAAVLQSPLKPVERIEKIFILFWGLLEGTVMPIPHTQTVGTCVWKSLRPRSIRPSETADWSFSCHTHSNNPSMSGWPNNGSVIPKSSREGRDG